MAQQSQYNWFDLAKPTIPYRSYTSPVDESPHLVPGSQNILGTEIGYLEKRPGFSTPIEDILSTVPGKIVRIFPWRRWSASFYVMLCTIDGGVAKVYKLQQGTDNSFVLIWTSTSATPFDFVVSDNFVFFGNATDMKKFDGITVSKWGADAPSTAPLISFINGTLPPGMSYSSATNILSGTPTALGTTALTFTATDSTGAVATQTFNFTVDPAILAFINVNNVPTQAQPGQVFSGATYFADYGTPAYTFTLFSGALPAGLSISSGGNLTGTVTGAPGLYGYAVKVTDSLSNTAVQSFQMYVSTGNVLTFGTSTFPDATVGTAYNFPVTSSGGTNPYTYAIDFGNIPPGITFSTTATTITFSGTPTTPGEYFFNVLMTDSASHAEQKGPFSITVHPTSFQYTIMTLPDAVIGHAYGPGGGGVFLDQDGGVAPITTTFTAGSLNAQSGYVWGYSYTTVYGHESNVSPLTVTTGPFTGLDAGITVIASPDPQVTGINIYRTTDGGDADPSIMRLVIATTNTNQTFIDSTQDVNLGLQTGPGFLINTPPPPQIGFVWSNGRIYGFFNNTTYYSGAEEVSNGIQEECWPSGADGNFYAWPAEVGGQAVTQNGVDIGMSEQFWQISGDTLDTFRKSLLLDKGGVRSPTCISSVGNSVQWVDTAKQIWSSSLGEFGEPIRSDLTGIDPVQTFIGYHKSRNFNWIYVLDALNSKLFIYDLDLNQWNAPWTVAATAIASGETALGVLSLMVAIGGHVMVLTPDTYVDDTATLYEDDLKFNLIPISPGRLTTGRSRITPTQVESIMFETNATAQVPPMPSFVGQLSDDNPVTTDISFWTDLTNNFATPQYQPQAQNIAIQTYICDSTTTPAVRSATWIKWAANNVAWKIYSFSISWIRA